MDGSEQKENVPDSVGYFGINPQPSAQIHSIQERYGVNRQFSVLVVF